LAKECSKLEEINKRLERSMNYPSLQQENEFLKKKLNEKKNGLNSSVWTALQNLRQENLQLRNRAVTLMNKK
jgi:predicted nuclease with TOPRIM domain